jgi:hypothetical protein
MPKAPWSFESVAVVSKGLDARSQEASSFALFAAWAVDDLYYLADIDLTFFTGGWRRTGFHPNVIDLTHTRWATGSAMTALDLVAAAIGALHMRPKANGEVYDLGSFGKGDKPPCPGCTAWIASVRSEFGWLTEIRNSLVHQTVNRGLFGGAADPDDIRPNRTEILLPNGSKKPVRKVIEDCRELAYRRVVGFFQAVINGTA